MLEGSGCHAGALRYSRPTLELAVPVRRYKDGRLVSILRPCADASLEITRGSNSTRYIGSRRRRPIPNFQPNDYLQRWAVSKRVKSSKADKDDATLIEPIELAA